MKIVQFPIAGVLIIVGISFSRCRPLDESFLSEEDNSLQSKYSVDNQHSTTRYRRPTTSGDLPEIGEAFSDVREKKKTFVDKTHFLRKFLDSPFYHKFSILARPPRFGKTFTLGMMESFFRGDKHLFKGTAIYERGNIATDDGLYKRKRGQWLKYPVIRLNFGQLMANYSTTKDTSFRARLKNQLRKVGLKFQIDCEGDVATLIEQTRLKFDLDVVLLVDDYDAPINYALDVLEDHAMAEKIREELTDFFEDIKGVEHHIKTTCIFGVTQVHPGNYFGKEALLKYDDLTYDKEFTSFVGFTPEELDTFMENHIQKFSQHVNRTYDDVMRELIDRYGGYRFSVNNETKVLNPVSAIECLRKSEFFDSYWCSNDSSLAYIIYRFFDERLPAEHFENYETSWQNFLFWGPNDVAVKSYKPTARSKIPLVIYMLVRGYLTIKSYNKHERKVTLGYPNDEVKKTIASSLECVKREKIKMNINSMNT